MKYYRFLPIIVFLSIDLYSLNHYLKNINFFEKCVSIVFLQNSSHFRQKIMFFSKYDLFVQFERKHIAMVDFNQECVCCFNHFRAVLAATFIIMTHSWVDFRVVQWHLHVHQLIQTGPQTCSKSSDIKNGFPLVI